jgi:glutathione synthase/RimK-type ligase-like ATP-grasp enzyme
MRVLLTEGSGLTSRQVVTRLGAMGHDVELVSSTPVCLSRFTRFVGKVHSAPRFGVDPNAWFDAANAIARDRAVDLVLPTHDQVAVLSARQAELCVPTVVPPFQALCRVQDKVCAARCLSENGVMQPPSLIATRVEDLRQFVSFPAFVKRPISTASSGVRRVASSEELDRAAREFGLGQVPILVQGQVDGPLAMVQAVVDRGRLIAHHANLRVREGIGGGASIKESLLLPSLETDLKRLVGALDWHGAISLDAILGPDGPVVIDVNPRIVEPMNAYLSGVDLVGAMLDCAAGASPAAQPAGRPGVRSRQLLLAVLGAAKFSDTRRAVISEIAAALQQRGDYAGAIEELTPTPGDPWSLLPVLAAAAATLLAPASWRAFHAGAVGAYALTPQAWEQLIALGR